MTGFSIVALGWKCTTLFLSPGENAPLRTYIIEIVFPKSSIQGTNEAVFWSVWFVPLTSGILDFPIAEHSNDVAEAAAWVAKADRAKSDDNPDRDMLYSFLPMIYHAFAITPPY